MARGERKGDVGAIGDESVHAGVEESLPASCGEAARAQRGPGRGKKSTTQGGLCALVALPLVIACAAPPPPTPRPRPTPPAIMAAMPYEPFRLSREGLEALFGGADGVAALRSCQAVVVKRMEMDFGVHEGVEGAVYGFLAERGPGVRIERDERVDEAVAALLDAGLYRSGGQAHDEITYVDYLMRFEGPDGEHVVLVDACDNFHFRDGEPAYQLMAPGGTAHVRAALRDRLDALADEAARRGGWTTRRP